VIRVRMALGFLALGRGHVFMAAVLSRECCWFLAQGSSVKSSFDSVEFHPEEMPRCCGCGRGRRRRCEAVDRDVTAKRVAKSALVAPEYHDWQADIDCVSILPFWFRKRDRRLPSGTESAPDERVRP